MLFLLIALPILIVIYVAIRNQSRHFDRVNHRLDDLRTEMHQGFTEVNRRLERIESKLYDHEKRITRVEADTSPITRRT
jgi:hypothetical protein